MRYSCKTHCTNISLKVVPERACTYMPEEIKTAHIPV